ncbi:hypothetical protein [Demequina aurantiaca]|uniref:hypothetical protein n=1 Tax=Demequina aurantiaca TaxID=676200 RepID=UPI003D3326ED
MSTPENDYADEPNPDFLVAANLAKVSLALAVMAVVLGVAAVLMPALSLWLAVFTLVESAGTIFFSTRMPADSLNFNAESRVRMARGLAMLAIALAAVAVMRSIL